MGCYIQKYKIQLASGTGPIYTDYTTVPNDIMSFNPWSVSSSKGSITCQNRDQPEPACANFDFTNTWGPVCCNDYRVDFCCLPEPPCQVEGAIQEFWNLIQVCFLTCPSHFFTPIYYLFFEYSLFH